MSSTISSEHGQGSVQPQGSGSRLTGEAAGGTGRQRSPLGETVGRYMVPLLFLVLTAYFAITLPNFRSSVNFGVKDPPEVGAVVPQRLFAGAALGPLHLLEPEVE